MDIRTTVLSRSEGDDWSESPTFELFNVGRVFDVQDVLGHSTRTIELLCGNVMTW
jgi:hypothetical protein